MPKRGLAGAWFLAVVLFGCQSPTDKLVEAIRARDHETIRAAIAAKKFDPYEMVAKDEDYAELPLSAAARVGDLETLGLLLDAGVDPNRGGVGREDQALGTAAAYGKFRAMKLLLDRGASAIPANADDHFDILGAMSRTCSGDVDAGEVIAILERLFASGVDPKGPRGETKAIEEAVRCEDARIVGALIAHGVPVRPNDFTVAARTGSIATLQELLKSDVKPGYDTCAAIRDNIKGGTGGADPRLALLAGRGVGCAEVMLADQRGGFARERAERERLREVRESERREAQQRAEEKRAAEERAAAAAPAARPGPSGPIALCNSKQTSCGRYCCDGASQCCRSDDTNEPVMCVAIRQGRGCPWGMH